METPSDDPHFFWTMYGPADAQSVDSIAVAQLRDGRCVRSGACCLGGLCPIAIMRGEQFGQRCSYLVGDRPGEYACQLALDGDEELIWAVGIDGRGCPEPRNLERLVAGRRQTELRGSREH